MGEVQALQDRLENLVIDRQFGCDSVGVLARVSFLMEVEQPGVVPVIGLAAQVCA